MTDKDIAQKIDADRRVAARWRARFRAAGVGGLMQDVAALSATHGAPSGQRERAGACHA